MAFENTLRASMLALSMATGLGGGLGAGLAGCGDSNPNGDSIPPLAPPGDGDTTLPDTVENRFNSCYPANQSLVITLDGRGASWGGGDGGTPTTMNGGSILAIDRASLSFLASPSGDGGTGGSGGGTADGGVTGGPNSFRAIARWASTPLEFYTENPGNPGYGLMATRTQSRANGDPLTDLRRLGMNGSWADQYPGFTSGAQLGFIWPIEGDFDTNSCRMRLRIHGAVRSSNGVSAAQPYVPVPLYSPRSDGRTRVAEAEFNNEGLAILNGALQVTFNFSGSPVGGRTSALAVVCDNNDSNADNHCKPITGSGLQHLEAQMIEKPLTNDAGPGDAGHPDAGSPMDSGTGADAGGIPPLPPPDAGMGGG